MKTVGVRRCLWCIDAAVLISPSPTRTKLISLLWTLTIPPESAHPVSSPRILRTLVQGIYLLLADSCIRNATEDIRVISDLLEHIKNCTNDKQLDSMTVEEEYNALFVEADSVQAIREAIVLQALVEYVEKSSPAVRRLLLQQHLQVQ